HPAPAPKVGPGKYVKVVDSPPDTVTLSVQTDPLSTPRAVPMTPTDVVTPVNGCSPVLNGSVTLEPVAVCHAAKVLNVTIPAFAVSALNPANIKAHVNRTGFPPTWNYVSMSG